MAVGCVIELASKVVSGELKVRSGLHCVWEKWGGGRAESDVVVLGLKEGERRPENGEDGGSLRCGNLNSLAWQSADRFITRSLPIH